MPSCRKSMHFQGKIQDRRVVSQKNSNSFEYFRIRIALFDGFRIVLFARLRKSNSKTRIFPTIFRIPTIRLNIEYFEYPPPKGAVWDASPKRMCPSPELSFFLRTGNGIRLGSGFLLHFPKLRQNSSDSKQSWEWVS